MSHQEHQLVGWDDIGLATLADWLLPQSSITVCYWIGPHLMAARPMSIERIDSNTGELRAWLSPGTKCRAIKTHHDGKPHLWNREDISSPSQDDEWTGSHVAFQFPLHEAGYTRAKLRPGRPGSLARVQEYYHDIGAIVGWSAHLKDGAVVPWVGNPADEVLTPQIHAEHASFQLHVQDYEADVLKVARRKNQWERRAQLKDVWRDAIDSSVFRTFYTPIAQEHDGTLTTGLPTSLGPRIGEALIDLYFAYEWQLTPFDDWAADMVVPSSQEAPSLPSPELHENLRVGALSWEQTYERIPAGPRWTMGQARAAIRQGAAGSLADYRRARASAREVFADLRPPSQAELDRIVREVNTWPMNPAHTHPPQPHSQGRPLPSFAHIHRAGVELIRRFGRR